MRALLLPLLLITNAYSVSINWQEDSPTSFAPTISGTGLPYIETFTSPLGPQGTRHTYSETFTSPSGLWELSIEIDIKDFYGPGIGDLVLPHTSSTATFLGLPDSISTVDDFLSSSGNIYRNEPVFYDYSRFNHDEWSGRTPLFITSVPDYRDPTTWTWVMSISAHGPSLTSVPESGGIVCLGLAALLLFAYKKKGQDPQRILPFRFY